jgi:hypothetical protein
MTRKAVILAVKAGKRIRYLYLQRVAKTFNLSVTKLRQIKIHWVLALIVLTCILSGFGIIAGSRVNVATLGSGGNIKVDGVGVYNDGNCSVATAYLDWGTREPGSSSNITVYIRNEGNQVATLFMTVDNWNPDNASDYMSLSWNYDGKMLSPVETAAVTLTLSVSPNVQNIVDFSFDVIIGTNG